MTRRASRPAGRATSGLVAAAAVVLVLLAGYLGGSADSRPATRTPVGAATLAQRTFVCTADLPGTKVLSGALPHVGERALKDAQSPLRLNVDRRRAAAAFATQVSRHGRNLAVQRCPEPKTRWWFVGVGGAVTHRTVLVVDNPRPGSATVDLDVFGPKGPVQAPGLEGVTIPGMGSRTFDLNEVAPAVGELAVRVRATRGLVTATAGDRHSLGGAGRVARDWVPAQPVPNRRLVLTGLDARPKVATLLLTNPGEVEAVVHVEVLGKRGRFVPEGLDQVRVPPRSVTSRRLPAATFDKSALAVRLTSPHPVVASVRASTGNDVSVAAAVPALRDTSVLALPPAARRELVLSAPSRPGRVVVTSYDGKGRSLGRRVVRVPAQTTVGMPVPGRATVLTLASTNPRVVAGATLHLDNGAIAGVAVPPGARAVRLPPVRPLW